MGEAEFVAVKLTLGINSPLSVETTSNIAEASGATPELLILTPSCENTNTGESVNDVMMIFFNIVFLFV